MRIYLVRHGETTGNLNDFYQTSETPLTKTGIEQAKSVAKRFKNVKIDVIYSSTHLRAKNTAELISKQVKAKVELWESLMEIRRPKEVRGKSGSDPEAEKIMQQVVSKFSDKTWKYSDEENFYDLKERADLVIAHLLSKHKGDTIVCVSHGTFIKFLVTSVLLGDHINPENFNLLRHNLWAQNTGVSVIEYREDKGLRLLAWNDTSHL